MNDAAQAVLDFWFTPDPGQPADAMRAVWFKKDDAFDAQIRDRFEPLVAQALGGGLRDWDGQGPAGALARILLLDQFCRNIYRNTPRAFAGDALAVASAQALVDAQLDASLPPLQRAFVYLPFEHAEDMAMQEQAVALYARLVRDQGPSASAALGKGLNGLLDYAHKHRAVIERFGRFPHRNPILGRASTPEELAYLAQPGSGF
ncbi:MAG: DUF924 family protein [Duganella sp.]